MAEGLSVALPLRIDPVDGAYSLNKTLVDMATQNLKMVILTSPGERVMEPEFGVGVRNYLFAQNSPGLSAQLRDRISQQVSKYLPYISLNNLQVFSPSILGDIDNTRLNIIINYSIPAANVVADLTIPIKI
jgi:phage baseplate assembly protein W